MQVKEIFLTTFHFIEGKDHSEERGEGDEDNEESNAPREGTSRGRFRGRYRGVSYRPRYFNRPRKNTEGEEVSGDKSHMDGDADQVKDFFFFCP